MKWSSVNTISKLRVCDLAPLPCEATLVLEPKIQSAHHDHSQSQTHELSRTGEVHKRKWTLLNVSKPVVLQCFIFLVERRLCLKNCHCFKNRNRFLHHVAVRRGNVASVRDVVFVSLVRTLFHSNPLRFDDYVLMVFKVQSFRFHLRKFTCTGSPSSLNRQGWLLW